MGRKGGGLMGRSNIHTRAGFYRSHVKGALELFKGWGEDLTESNRD